MKTLFVSDLDGTLITREERVSAYSIEKINRMIDVGMLFTYATARSAASAAHAVSGLRVGIPAILYNGGLIYNFNNKETLRAIYFDDEVKRCVFEVLRSCGIRPFVFGAIENRELLRWHAGDESFGMHRYLDRRSGDKRIDPVTSDEELLDCYVFYFKCIGPRDSLERAWNILKYDERLLCIFHQETYQKDFWMEISPREASKANAVAFLKNYLNCDKTVCFGDTSNDSDMFDVCEEKYAVMNADGWLKAKATGVIGYCEEDGVAKWLERNSGF